MQYSAIVLLSLCFFACAQTQVGPSVRAEPTVFLSAQELLPVAVHRLLKTEAEFAESVSRDVSHVSGDTSSHAKMVISADPYMRVTALGAERAPDVDRAVELMHSDELEAAEALLLDVVVDIRHHMVDPLVAYASTPTADDFELYDAVHGYDERPMVRLSGAFAAALHYLAYIEVERGHVSKAMDYIDEHLVYAPTSAKGLAELGQILNQAQMPDHARVAFQEAVSRATLYPGSQSELGVALRGLGYALIELGELHRAQDVFHKSLRVEPENEIAEWELLYIQELMAEQRDSAVAQADASALARSYCPTPAGSDRPCLRRSFSK